MGHCMSYECPPGLVFDPVTLYCVLPDPDATPTPTPHRRPAHASPSHPARTAILEPSRATAIRAMLGTWYWAAVLYCYSDPTPTPRAAVSQSCPDGYFWHPAMGHCMSYECPPGLVFDPGTLYCVLPP